MICSEVLIVLQLSFFIIFYYLYIVEAILEDEYPQCGSCWCIPENNGTGSCPTWRPETSFPTVDIIRYRNQQPQFIYTLSCNPYTDNDCVTEPAQQMIDEEEAVCAFIYEGRGKICASAEYKMVTFASYEEALRNGGIVTHTGSCGLCSTTQDLALYLTEDFTQAGKKCAAKGVINEQAGLECYMDLGLTEECAKIWNYDGIYDSRACLSSCIGYLTKPNNGPPPACELNPCLQCDEDKAGPLFSAFAGRTRRRSGLRSEIIRSCDSIARIFKHDPCIQYTIPS